MSSQCPASALEEFRRLYRAGQFFEAHEILEDTWREATGETRERLHGLIHGAVARYHHENGNAEGAARQSVRAHIRLEGVAAEAAFLRELNTAIAPSLLALDAGAWERLRQLESRLRAERKVRQQEDGAGQSVELKSPL